MKFRTIENLKDVMKQGANKVLGYKIDFKVSLWLKAFIESMAEGLFSIQGVFKDAILQLFPQNATGEFLEMWGDWEGVPKNEAQPASGLINIIGDGAGSIGVVIEAGTQFQSENGIIYETLSDVTMVEVEDTVDSFVISGGVATVETYGNHALASGQSVFLDILGIGSIEAENITVIDETTFSFLTDLGNVASSGTMTNWFIEAEVEATSEGFDTNQDSGAVLNLIDSIDSTILEQAYVKADGLTGGLDEEEQEAYRARIALSRQQMRGVFTDDQNVLAGLRVAGNSEIIVDNPVAGVEDIVKVAGFQPVAGEVVFYIIRRDENGDIDETVDPDILAETKQSIIDYGKLPSHVCEDDIHVFSPLLEPLDVTLSITPDNATNRTAVENSIKAWIQDNQSFDAVPTINGLISAINATPNITGFSVSVPTSITVTAKHILVAGTITFS